MGIWQLVCPRGFRQSSGLKGGILDIRFIFSHIFTYPCITLYICIFIFNGCRELAKFKVLRDAKCSVRSVTFDLTLYLLTYSSTLICHTTKVKRSTAHLTDCTITNARLNAILTSYHILISLIECIVTRYIYCSDSIVLACM